MYTTLMSSNKSETAAAVFGSLLMIWMTGRLITDCHQNRSLVPQLIETSVYFGWFGMNPVI